MASYEKTACREMGCATGSKFHVGEVKMSIHYSMVIGRKRPCLTEHLSRISAAKNDAACPGLWGEGGYPFCTDRVNSTRQNRPWTLEYCAERWMRCQTHVPRLQWWFGRVRRDGFSMLQPGCVRSLVRRFAVSVTRWERFLSSNPALRVERNR